MEFVLANQIRIFCVNGDFYTYTRKDNTLQNWRYRCVTEEDVETKEVGLASIATAMLDAFAHDPQIEVHSTSGGYTYVDFVCRK